jgi:hypothetical protein
MEAYLEDYAEELSTSCTLLAGEAEEDHSPDPEDAEELPAFPSLLAGSEEEEARKEAIADRLVAAGRNGSGKNQGRSWGSLAHDCYSESYLTWRDWRAGLVSRSLVGGELQFGRSSEGEPLILELTGEIPDLEKAERDIELQKLVRATRLTKKQRQAIRIYLRKDLVELKHSKRLAVLSREMGITNPRCAHLLIRRIMERLKETLDSWRAAADSEKYAAWQQCYWEDVRRSSRASKAHGCSIVAVHG